MKFYAECVACLSDSALRKAQQVSDPQKRLEYMQKVCAILQAADPQREAPPLVDARIIQLRRTFLGIEDDYGEIKRRFNGLILGLYDQLKARVMAAEDQLLEALKLSMYGNYIDFGVLHDVDPEELMRLLDQAEKSSVDEEEYAHLRLDLEGEGEMIFIHDNCGEVVLDKLLLETIHRLYPGLKLVSLVRGAPVLNDATREDAAEVGLGEVAEVIDNGLKDIAGTQLDMLSPALLERIQNAKLLIAKGQGNFETLIGCGLNLYYLFLSKCAGYTRWFGFERFSGILKNDRRLNL